MVKVVLKGSPATQWNIGKGSIAGGTVVNLDKDLLVIAEKNNLIEYYIDTDNAKPADLKVKYTETELFALKKAEQVVIIEALGLKPASKEAGRVKQILEAQ